MLRALILRACARRKAHRQAQAEARCTRMLGACSNPAHRSVMAWAAGQCRDPLQRARVLADLTAAFNYGV